jgi:hypothetical protein
MIDRGSASFAVVFADGNREINVGTVVVDPSLNFKRLLSILSQRIGISPHQFSVYLATSGSDRKIPINSKVNLAALNHDGGGYYFFVKRSRRSKKASPPNKNGKGSPPNKKNLPENVMLLRRGRDRDAAFADSGFMSPSPPPLILDRGQYEKRMMNLRLEREVFLMNMGIDGLSIGRETTNEVSSGGGGNGRAVCEECLRAKLKGIDSGFHLCVEDTVTNWFRSPAGPISRPTKNSGKECP